MPIADALMTFEDICLRNVDNLRVVPALLCELGFAQTDQIAFDDSETLTAILLEKPSHDYAVSYILSTDGTVSSVAIIVAADPSVWNAYTTFASAQPKAKDTTTESLSYVDLLPDQIARAMTGGQFWSSKAPNEVGRNLMVTKALFQLSGKPAYALTVDRNLALKDAPDADGWVALTGPDSKLQRHLDLFRDLAFAHAPDPSAIHAAAMDMGFRGDSYSDPEYSLGGPMGLLSTNVHLNTDTDFDFECALTFILDERIPPLTVKQSLFNMADVSEHQGEGWGRVALRGKWYWLVYHCQSEMFGNHIFLLQK